MANLTTLEATQQVVACFFLFFPFVCLFVCFFSGNVMLVCFLFVFFHSVSFRCFSLLVCIFLCFVFVSSFYPACFFVCFLYFMF